MKQLLTAVALAVTALAASAQTLTFTPVNPITFSGFNPDPPSMVATQSAGYRNSVVSASAPGILTATFLGKEALDTDTYTFTLASGTLMNTGAIGASIMGPVAAGAIPFTFADTTVPSTAPNGGGAGFASYVVLGSFSGGGTSGTFTPYTGPGGIYQLVLGFNDGLQVDGDNDDMIVGLRINMIPEPETYALMLAGLGAIGFIARRRQRSAR